MRWYTKALKRVSGTLCSIRNYLHAALQFCLYYPMWAKELCEAGFIILKELAQREKKIIQSHIAKKCQVAPRITSPNPSCGEICLAKVWACYLSSPNVLCAWGHGCTGLQALGILKNRFDVKAGRNPCRALLTSDFTDKPGMTSGVHKIGFFIFYITK